jgi:hypothetical protein
VKPALNGRLADETMRHKKEARSTDMLEPDCFGIETSRPPPNL